MNPKTIKKLSVIAPPAIILILLLAITMFGHQRLLETENRLQLAENELSVTKRELLEAKTNFVKIENQLALLGTEDKNVRLELVKIQRGNYDHEQMLSAIFKIEKSGDSIVGFQRQHNQAMSIGLTK